MGLGNKCRFLLHPMLCPSGFREVNGMTIWEKAVLSMQKGAQKMAAASAMVSERVRAEVSVARLRLKLGEVQSMIDEQYRIIGRRVVNLKNGDALPKTAEQLVYDEEIAAAVAEIGVRKKERDDLHQEIEIEQGAFKSSTKKEDTKI